MNTSFSAKLLTAAVWFLLSPLQLLHGQQPNAGQTQVNFVGTLPPAVASINAAVLGTPGVTVYCYFVVAHYPAGDVLNSQPTSAGCVNNANSTLSGSNYVQVGWAGTTNATSYDLIRQAGRGNLPATCTSCVVAASTTAVSVADNGGALTNFTSAGFAVPNPRTTLFIDNEKYATAQLVLSALPLRVINGNVYYGDGTSSSAGGTLHNVALITDTNDANILGFTASATTPAVDYFNMLNAVAAGTPIFSVVGTDTNIPLSIRSKGTSSVFIHPSTNTRATAAFVGVAAAVNGTITTPGITGTDVIFGSGNTGADANAGLRLAPNGSGTVKITGGTDPTKLVAIDAAGQATGLTHTFAFSDASTGKTTTFPNATGTVPYTVFTNCATASACSATTTSSTSKITYGVTGVLDGASPATVTVTGMPAFTGTTTFTCHGTIIGTAATTSITQVTNVSTSSVTFYATNGATGTVAYLCGGN